jgi:hypothetical protein
MQRIRRRFLKLLVIEMESLKEELEIIIGTLDERLRNHEITDYVRNENFAVLRNEVLGVQECIRNCAESELSDGGTSDGGTELSEAQSVEELAETIKSCMRRRLEDHGYVPAVYNLVDRRVDKIAAYLSVDADSPVV